MTDPEPTTGPTALTPASLTEDDRRRILALRAPAPLLRPGGFVSQGATDPTGLLDVADWIITGDRTDQ